MTIKVDRTNPTSSIAIEGQGKGILMDFAQALSMIKESLVDNFDDQDHLIFRALVEVALEQHLKQRVFNA